MKSDLQTIWQMRTLNTCITPRIRALLATGSVPIVIVYLMVISMAVYGRKSRNFFFEFLWPNIMQDTEFFY